jgi:type VI secretion system secreted protein VgrG
MDNDAQTDAGALLYQQDDRLLILDSPLGRDNVILTELHGEDAISSPFRYKITFATSLDSAKVKSLLGQKVTVLFGSSPAEDRRPLNALVRHLSGPAPGPRGFKIWQAELAPQLAFLGLTQDCRMFQKQSVLDILRSVFKAHGLDQFEFRQLMGHYQPLEYCVQYRETALNFVSRLMEHSGLFYWHEFTASNHTLVITDSNVAAKSALEAHAKLPAESGFPDIDALAGDYTFRPGKWTLTDYDFTSPTKTLLSHTPTMYSEPAMTPYEMFDFPGQYYDPQDGDTLTRLRMEHEEMRFHTLSGTGRRATFDAGHTVELDNADAQALDIKGKLLFTAVWHEAADHSFVTQNATPAYYRNRFEAIPTERPYRPACTTPKPVVQGVQCAVVVGPPGEYIYTDEHGRVKVRFFWDRNPFGNPDENRSCWLRVSQAWADGQFGGVHLPRIGQEVLVDFLEGDPDRPLVTGRVYNGDNTHPYKLPGNKNQSGFKSQSVPPNGGWNEFYFEDTAGSEVLYMRAQKDHNHDVLNNHGQTIGNDHTHKVGNDHSHSVGHDHTHKVGHDHNQHIGHNHNNTVINDYNVTVNNNHNTNITNDYNVTVNNNHNLFIEQDYNITCTASITQVFTTESSDTGPLKKGAYGIGLNAYGMYLNTYGLKMDIPGINLTFYGVKGDFGIYKLDYAWVKSNNAPITVDAAVTKIKTTATSIKNTGVEVATAAGAKIQTAATSIKNFVLDLTQ